MLMMAGARSGVGVMFAALDAVDTLIDAFCDPSETAWSLDLVTARAE
jgi:hypothetical protein